MRKKFVYNTSHSFSVRTNRDKFQSSGELYVDDGCLINQDKCISLVSENDTSIEGLIIQDNFKSKHCPLTDVEFQKNIDRNTEEMVFIDEEIQPKLRK